MVTVIVELNRIPVNDNIPVPEEVHRDLIDDIRVYVFHNTLIGFTHFLGHPHTISTKSGTKPACNKGEEVLFNLF